jgi:hypothetical protein
MARHALPSWEWPVAGVAHLAVFSLVAVAQCGSGAPPQFKAPDAIIVEMAGPATAETRMPQRAERAPTPASGAPSPELAPPPPNPSELALPTATPTKGNPEGDRADLMAELRKQQLLADLNAPEGQTNRLESGSPSDQTGTRAQSGVHDPELARWVVKANEELGKNFHPLPSWCASNPNLVARAAAPVRADGSVADSATIVETSRNASFDAACIRAFETTKSLPPLPARFASGFEGVLECPCK